MTDHVRIKDPVSGAEYTYDTAKVEALGLSEYVIKKDPLGPDGLPAPAKPRLPLGEALPGSAQDRRNTAKRAAKKTAPKAAKKAAPKTTEASDLGDNAGQTSSAAEEEN